MGSLQGRIASQMLVKGNRDSWYEVASIPVETLYQSVRKNNLWYYRRFWSYLITDQCVILACKSDVQIWLVTLAKQLYWGFVHTTLEIFENGALFLGLSLPCRIICHENGRSLSENTVQTRRYYKKKYQWQDCCLCCWLVNVGKG